MARLKVGVLISGRGSNLQALLDACMDSAFPAQIVRVISNIPGVFGLERAKAANVPTLVINHKDYKTREEFEAAITKDFRIQGVELVLLAGFMRLVTPSFINAWEGRLINIHPSLLPAFKGVHVHEAVIANGVRFSGCTTHFVVPEMDSGPIITQAVVAVKGEDSPDTLAARILEAEHIIYPQTLRLFAEGRLQVKDGKVLIKNHSTPDSCMVNPAKV